MSKLQETNPDYDIVIIECCENCETHQQFARHSEWKYFEQFNQLKRKIEKFVNNTIVIKNPVPDQLIKTPQNKNEKNVFVNKDNNEKIIFPRIGSFQIYIYNILIYSKLITTQWPNHYKILQTIAKMIEEKKKGSTLDHFSVYSQPGIGSNALLQPKEQIKQQATSGIAQDKKITRILSKKKKGNSLAGRAYRSIDRANETLKDLKSTLDPFGQKLINKQDISGSKSKRAYRYLQSKVQPRVKLPALSNTLKNFKEENKYDIQPVVQKQRRIAINTIDELQRQQFSAIEHKDSELIDNQKLSFLNQQPENMKNSLAQELEQSQDLKFMENRSAQYSRQDDGKDLMNRSIQYQEQQGFYCDFGMQIDQDYLNKQKQLNFHWVQTQKVDFKNDNKPYTLDQEVQAKIELKIPTTDQFSQTITKQFVDQTVGTQILIVVNREIQFPEQIAKSFNINQTVDTNFQHLFQKRRNLLNNQNSYSIDRFQEKSSKYKWVGRANLAESTQDLKKQMFLQSLVFSVYNYFGIKTPEKRLSYQICSNVIGDKLKEALMHVMTFDNPELQYLHAFQDFNYNQKKIPFSEVITFKASKQPIKFNNYGGFLALAYFLNDYEVYNQHNTSMGLVIVNEAVKQIHKLSALNYQIHPQTKSSDEDIIVNERDNLTMKISRLSVNVELDFFAMLSRITDLNNFDELIKYIKQIFLHAANSYQQFKMTILSLHLQEPIERTVEDFISMLENRVSKLREAFKGKLYTYKKYHALSPAIKYKTPFEHKIERKLSFKDKLVNLNDIAKHLRNNNTLVLIQAEQGSGKTTLLTEMVSQLKSVQKINVMFLPWVKRDSLKVKSEFFQLSKNILFIDNADQLDAQVIQLIQSLREQKCEASFCIATTRRDQIQMLKSRFASLNIVETKLLPFNVDEIKQYLMKVIKWRSYTDKKDIVDLLVSKNSYVNILQNPFFLSLLSYNISGAQNSSFKVTDKIMTKYMILKEHFSLCTSIHNDQMKQMGLKIKQALPSLRRIAFEYYHNVFEVNEAIKDIVTYYEEDQLIRNQLAYYPLCLESVVSANYQHLFPHRIFLDFFLIQSYSYFVQQSYRSMHMQKIYSDKLLLQLITQRYKLENSYNKLLEVVYSSKKFKNTAQSSSNAITLLNKIGYVFSNLNFDDVVIPFADLSNSIFYQCSFRGADLQQAIMYKSQMISCIFDAASMNKINLFSKKYQIEFTATTCSISVDGRKLAFGCGNYLIIMNAQTGAQLKRIEAHLDIIRLVKFTKDGNSLITIADDKTLRIWDIYTFKSVVFKLPQKGSISYSNETESIASVNKNVLKVWNLKSMANEAQLQGHTEAITTIQFSFDGQLILTGSKDSTLRLWFLKGKQKMVFKGHDEEILVGKLSPLKRTMVSSSKGKDLIVWQIDSGSKLLNKKFTSQINELCLDNKEKYIVATFNTDNHIIVMDFLSLQIVHVLSGHEAKVLTISFDHNFQQLISLGKDRTARVWQFQKIMTNQIRNPKIYKKITKTGITALAYDKIKLKYITAHQNGEINVWNSEDNSHLDQLHSHNGPVRCLAVDKSSKIYSGGQDGGLRIWNLQTKKQPKIIQIHSTQMLQLKLSERNRFIATCSAANELVIQDFTGIKIIMSTREEGRISAIAFSQDQKYMAVGGAQKYVAIYEMVNASSVHRAIELGAHSDPITSICFFSDALVVVALKNGQVAIWNFQKVSLMKKIENVSPIKSLIVFQKKYLSLSSEDGKIRIVNMDQGRQMRVFKYSEAAAALDTNEDQSLLLVGTSGGNLLKWNLNCVKPPTKKIEFDRKAIDRDCSQIVTIQGSRLLLVKDLLYHKQTLLEVKVDSDVEGVTFDDQKIIMLLKNGKYWQYGKKQYRFNTSSNFEGDLFSIRDKNVTNFYKSGIKKIKGMNKPSLSIIEEVNLQ